MVICDDVPSTAALVIISIIIVIIIVAYLYNNDYNIYNISDKNSVRARRSVWSTDGNM